MSSVYRVFLDKLGGSDATTFIGNEGELFYDPTSATLRISDGATPGGVVLSGASGLNLSEAADTLISNAESGDGLVYDGSRFKNSPQPQDTVYHAQYKFKHEIDAFPNIGEFQANSSTLSSATVLYINATTEADVDLRNLFVALAGKGRVVYIQDKDDSNNWHIYRITDSANLIGDRLHLNVSHVEGNGKMSNNQKCMVSVLADSVTDSVTPVAAPASPTESGTVGQVRFSTTHLYICVEANTWKRVDLSTF